MILCHVYRLTHVGRVCSGDFANGANEDLYLIKRGKLYFGILIFYWILMGLIALCCIACVFKSLKRRIKNREFYENGETKQGNNSMPNRFFSDQNV